MERFEKIYKEQHGVFDQTEIWVDRETGVHYLWHRSGYGGGLSPLLDAEGKPVVRKKEWKD